MTLKDRIYILWSFGKLQFTIGAVYNLSCAWLLLNSMSYSLLVDSFILKAVVYALTLYLASQFRKRDSVFFYINLGFSQRKLHLCVLLIDFLALALLLTAAAIIHGQA